MTLRLDGHRVLDGPDLVAVFDRRSAAYEYVQIRNGLDDLLGNVLSAKDPAARDEHGVRGSDIRGDVFNEGGKWKYTVSLDYELVPDIPSWDAHRAAVAALVRSTDAGTSGVTMRRIPSGWTLTVLDTPAGYPVTVHG